MTEILRDKAALRARVTAWKRAGETVGVVPTMGALHQGHLSLVQAATAGADRVIVTIFVNPKQFNTPSDLENYPRTEHADADKLVPFGVDAVYVPGPDEIYPDGFATSVHVEGLTGILCGAFRPGHFDGVTTVVSKLFLQTGADRAWFGEKDYQQLQVVRRMARDLDIPIEVIGCPTVREPDGLALSSRNLLLPADARARAPAMGREMRGMAEALTAGRSMAELTAHASAALAQAGFDKVEYLELRAADGLALLDRADRPARLLAAAWIGGVRLIDNIAVG
ncbi:pantoate--beta-alanine ligase [Salipiger aestuarii]|uniref:Pantothenate synthetase n=1 Tax=Salipiger aestuarii TaxID=568098 RepID=A0A327Y4B3_9RHOB|nr:pantoate--beta-alanine ligase [Salipiger aestuarii]EIE49351.1 pantoate--beta-alanine ligase [Citreicella sp. 357]KAA8607219.1 pantoate--beta-alanine ligase [Salipiger aestuarii]KAA8610288.1 pantoate--beta-alanine ligase [Salipiger aestuarii]KAB2541686.1 pantoate--beta-alanine ligase [Salipiger aestuarii]RAK15267.1 pantoate--beta-alanine ligase [Salipiger aestuarii]